MRALPLLARAASRALLPALPLALLASALPAAAEDGALPGEAAVTVADGSAATLASSGSSAATTLAGSASSAATAATAGAAVTGALPTPAGAMAENAPEPLPDDFRIGFWEFDLLSVDHEPRGTTVKILDLKIFKLFEFGSGDDYQAFSAFEVPELLSPVTVRREGEAQETRILDVQALSTAVFREDRESADEADTHVMKLPVVGSVYSRESDFEEPDKQEETVLFVIRQDVPRVQAPSGDAQGTPAVGTGAQGTPQQP